MPNGTLTWSFLTSGKSNHGEFSVPILSSCSLICILLRYYSPYPLIESEPDDPSTSSSQPYQKIPGVARATPRSHGRTSDLLAGGLGRHHSGEATLWVCHFCFKYMVDGIPWESHKVGLWYLASPILLLMPVPERLQSEEPTRSEGLSTRCTYYLGD